MAHCVTELSQLNAYLPLEKFPIYGNLGGKFFSSLPGAFNSVHTTPYHIFADVISFFCWVLCGSPQKLDNLNRCKMACKLKQKGPFYEKVLRQQIQESRSA